MGHSEESHKTSAPSLVYAGQLQHAKLMRSATRSLPFLTGSTVTILAYWPKMPSIVILLPLLLLLCLALHHRHKRSLSQFGC